MLSQNSVDSENILSSCFFLFSIKYHLICKIDFVFRKDDSHLYVAAGWIHHRVPTFGYVIKEKERPGRINEEKLLALGIKPGKM